MYADATRDLLTSHYLLTAFVASIGVIQLAAASANLRGLWFLPNPKLTYALGGVLIIGAFMWFIFAPLIVEGPWGNGPRSAESLSRDWGQSSFRELGAARNVNDINGGLAGNAQATLFPAGAMAAVLLTLAATSLINLRLSGRKGRGYDGVEALKTEAYVRSLPLAVKYWRSMAVQELSRQFGTGAHQGGLRDIWDFMVRAYFNNSAATKTDRSIGDTSSILHRLNGESEKEV